MTNGLRKHVEPQTEQDRQPETATQEKANENRDASKTDVEMTSKSK